MPYELLSLQVQLPGLMLVMARVLGLAFSAPIFSSMAVPRLLKAYFALATALMAYPLVEPVLPQDLTLTQSLAGMTAEAMIGMAIGFGLSVVFSGVQLAGSMIDQQAGIAMGQVLNPAMDSSATVMGQFLFFIMLVVFLAANGHVAVVRATLESFQHVPPLSFRVTPSVVDLLVNMLASSFILAIRIGGPVLLSLFLVMLAKGFISRTVPQLNVLAVGFSIPAKVAILFTAISLIQMQDLMVDGLVDTMDKIQTLLKGQA